MPTNMHFQEKLGGVQCGVNRLAAALLQRLQSIP